MSPHAEAAVAGVRAAPRLPHKFPEQPPVSPVDRPRVVGSGCVENAVDRKHAADDAEGAAAAVVQLPGAFTADDGRIGRPPTNPESTAAPTATRGQPGSDARAPHQL